MIKKALQRLNQFKYKVHGALTLDRMSAFLAKVNKEVTLWSELIKTASCFV